MNHLSVFSLDFTYSQLKRRACAKKLHAPVVHVAINYVPPTHFPFLKPLLKYSVWMMFDTSVFFLTAPRKTGRAGFCSSSHCCCCVSVWTWHLFRMYWELEQMMFMHTLVSPCMCVCVCVTEICILLTKWGHSCLVLEGLFETCWWKRFGLPALNNVM